MASNERIQETINASPIFYLSLVGSTAAFFYFFLSTRFSLSHSLVFTSFNKKITDIFFHTLSTFKFQTILAPSS